MDSIYVYIYLFFWPCVWYVSFQYFIRNIFKSYEHGNLGTLLRYRHFCFFTIGLIPTCTASPKCKKLSSFEMRAMTKVTMMVRFVGSKRLSPAERSFVRVQFCGAVIQRWNFANADILTEYLACANILRNIQARGASLSSTFSRGSIFGVKSHVFQLVADMGRIV